MALGDTQVDVEYLKSTYKEVAESYPKIFNHGEWIGFDVFRSARHITYVKASPGNGTQYRFFIIEEGGVVGFPEGCMLLSFEPEQRWGTVWLRSYRTHPNYLMEKLGMNEADAVAVANILLRLENEAGH